jgi:signal transduction histidine kinase
VASSNIAPNSRDATRPLRPDGVTSFPDEVAMSSDEIMPCKAPGGRASVVVLVVAWGLALAALVIMVFTEPSWHPGQWYGLVDTADAVVFGAVAALLLARGRHPVSWLVATCGIGGGLAAVGFQWSMLVSVRSGLPSMTLLQSAQNWAWLPGTYAMVILVPVLVRRVPLRGVDTAFVAVGSTAIIGLTLIRLTDPYPWPEGPTMAPLAIRSQWWLETIERSTAWQFAVVCVLAGVAIVDLVRRWHGGRQADRAGLGWLVVGAGLMAAAFVPLALPSAWTAQWPIWLTPSLHLASQLFFPAALLVAILGQRISGLEFAIGRATLWGLLSGALVVIYVSIVAVGTRVLSSDDVVVVAVAAAAVALAVAPLRRLIQRRIDALIRGDDTTTPAALGHVGRRLGSAADDTELLTVIAESVRHALRLGGLAVEVDWPGGARRVASVGELHRTSTETRELVVQRQSVGRIMVSGRPGERLDETTLDALDDLSPMIATVVQLVARTRELTESRSRIVEARDEERRLLRRELHDGFGPSLAGVALGLRAAGNLLESDPVVAAELISQMAAELDGRVEEVRSLARGLLPPVLDELGLVPAIEELAERHRITAGLDVQVIADDVQLDRRVSQAVYGIVAEAVRNVVRHAHASHCTIAIRPAADGVVVHIDDDGSGLQPGRPNGVGLSSMRERAIGVGGSFAVHDLGPGTRVDVLVPTNASVGAAS